MEPVFNPPSHRDLSTVSRKVIPIAELTAFHRELARQLGS